MTTGAILSVRIATALDRDTAVQCMEERRSAFEKVPGLLDKHFGYDDATGNICGLYVFESREALNAYVGSDLAASIPDAYDAVHVRRETYDLVQSVRREV